MTLETIMTREVATVSMDTTLREIRHLFAERRFHHVVVTDKQRVMGMVSDRDLLRNLSPFIATPSERTADGACLNRHAHQIMTRKLIVGTPGMTINAAAGLLLRHKISCLPVLAANGACVGIVTWRDLLRAAYPHALQGDGQQSATAELRKAA